MAFLFGSGQKNISTTENKLSGVQIQNSSQGVPIAIVYGKTRVSINSLWYGDFVAIPHTETQSSGGGKGGGGGGSVSTTSYTYTTGWVGGVCEGPIAGFGTVWESKNITTTASLGLTEFLGTYLQTPWSYLTTNHPTEAFGYRGQAYVATAAYNLGISSSLPNLSFEVKGLLFDACIYDVTVAQVFYDVLISKNYGAEFPSSQVGPLTDLYTYCRAAGLVVSPAYITQRAAADIVTELALVGNSAPVWSEGVLKMIPYAEAEVSGDWVGCGPTPPDPPFVTTTEIPVGSSPYGLSITSSGNTCFVSNAGGDSVSVIDIPSRAVIHTTSVGDNPIGNTLTPDGMFDLTCNYNDSTLSKLSASTYAVAATISVPDGAAYAAVTPDSSKAYVTSASLLNNVVSVVNLSSNVVTANISVGASLPSSGFNQQGIAIRAAGDFAYVCGQSDNVVMVIDVATNLWVDTIAVGTQPAQIVVLPDGSKAYVTNSGDGTVSVINLATNTVTATITVGAGEYVFSIAVSQDGAFVYVTDLNADTISKIATASNTVVGTVTAGGAPNFVAVTPDGSLTLSTNFIGIDTVSVRAA